MIKLLSQKKASTQLRTRLLNKYFSDKKFNNKRYNKSFSPSLHFVALDHPCGRPFMWALNYR